MFGNIGISKHFSFLPFPTDTDSQSWSHVKWLKSYFSREKKNCLLNHPTQIIKAFCCTTGIKTTTVYVYI